MLMRFFMWLNKFKNTVFKAGILHPLVSNGVLNCLSKISMFLTVQRKYQCFYLQTKTNGAHLSISQCHLGHLHLHFRYSLSRKIHYTFFQPRTCLLAIIECLMVWINSFVISFLIKTGMKTF